jgi:hypothetical protein
MLKDDLLMAKALINSPRKWRKDGTLAQGRMCIVNAIIEAVGSEHTYPCEVAVSEALGIDSASREVIGQFNDHPATTHADIMALFDRAISEATRHA